MQRYMAKRHEQQKQRAQKFSARLGFTLNFRSIETHFGFTCTVECRAKGHYGEVLSGQSILPLQLQENDGAG
jgi:hypothetical protein